MDRSSFPLEQVDTGRLTLEAFAQASHFNRWMYDTIRPWMGDRIAELGAGTGNLSVHFVDHPQVLLSDHAEEHVQVLRHRWGQAAHVQVDRFDMAERGHYTALTAFAPETVVFTNVLEHIEDDRDVLRNIHEHVPSGCRLVVLVPYDMKLFSRFDREVGHFRRYAQGELERKLEGTGFVVEHQHYFNKAGRVAWYLLNTLGGRRRISSLQLRLYDLFTPLFRLLDRVVPGPGLSTIVVAHKP